MAEQCKAGNEFVVVQVTERVSNERNQYAVDEKCPSCEKTFPRMVIRVSDGLGYLPNHNIPVPKKAPGRPKKEDQPQVEQVQEQAATAVPKKRVRKPKPEESAE